MKNKILTVQQKIFTLLVIFIELSAVSHSQNLPVSRYGLPFVNSVRTYKETIANHPEKQMISLKTIPGIFLDLRYATMNNFVHKNLYAPKTSQTFLRKSVYDALKLVAINLAKRGYGLIVYDAYRPYSVTEIMWTIVNDARYAADPAKGSGHNRGISVDLSLYDLKTNHPLIMPTDFDNFTDTAHLDFMNLDCLKIQNRDLLKQEMLKQGFTPLETEWWHYSWSNPKQFEILDLNFEQLDSISVN